MSPPGSRVLVPIRGADPRRRPPPGSGLEDVVPVVEDGALLTFSGVESVRRWRTVARFVTARRDEVDELARHWGAREVLHDVAGPIRTRRPCPGSSRLDTPPFELRGLAGPLGNAALDRLRDVLKRHPPIENAWVVEATTDGSEVVVAAFDVEPGHADPAALVRSLTEEIAPLLPVDLYEGAQVVVLADAEIAAAVRAADEPVYVRS